MTLERPGITVVLDVNDLDLAAEFWSAALGFPVQRPITQFMVLRPDDPEDHRPHLILQKVPEDKVAKNRVHLDVRAAPGLQGEERMAALEQECARLVALGAKRVHRHEPALPLSYGHIVMTDPEGNEFCLD